MNAEITLKTTHPVQPEWDHAIDIYREAFPPSERIPEDLLVPSNSTTMYLAQTASGQTVGMAFVAHYHTFDYLYYLAIAHQSRGAGYGSCILTALRQRHSGRDLTLMIEPITADAPNARERVRRLRFYQRNGLHTLPAHIIEEGQPYQILATNPQFQPQLLLEGLQSTFGTRLDYELQQLP